MNKINKQKCRLAKCHACWFQPAEEKTQTAASPRVPASLSSAER